MGIRYFEKVNSFYLIGIGGISMSSIAAFLLDKGYAVRGSDIAENNKTESLRQAGARVYVPHDAMNLTDEPVVIHTDAVGADNCELAYARQSGRLVLSRAEFLHLMSVNFTHTVFVAGSHGKTTTTSMLAHVFAAAGKRFCAHIGGDDLIYGNFIDRGDDYFISEACEYKKNILKLKGETAVLLNADADHMECYRDKKELDETFSAFLSASRHCVADAAFAPLPENAVTFSTEKGCYYPENIRSDGEKYAFDIIERDEFLCRVGLRVYGKQHIGNALAAAATARLYGIGGACIQRGLEEFRGVRRRFEDAGRYGGARVICDYAHHPKEIAAAFATAEKMTSGRLFVVFQPHTYSRTKFLMEGFVRSLKGAERLLVYRTYAAREKYDAEGSAEALAARLPQARYADSLMGLRDFLSEAREGDLILVLGAGDIDNLMKILLA